MPEPAGKSPKAQPWVIRQNSPRCVRRATASPKNFGRLVSDRYVDKSREEYAIAIDAEPERVQVAAMLQSWCSLTFLHWRYRLESLRPYVPEPLEVESFDGSAWVGITPFVVRDLRPVVLPPLPWISHFPETNCRTYVRGPDGHAGVWFFSLDAARAAAVAGARLGYGLPYAWSRMRVSIAADQVVYESARRWPDTRARTRFVIAPGKPIVPNALELFLTARYRLYAFRSGRLTYTSVEHKPWPLQAARLLKADQTLTECAGLPRPEGFPIVHFSQGVRVRVAFPQRIHEDRCAAH